MNKISIIFPVLNEVSEVETFKALIEKFDGHQIIFCDSGSTDGTVEALAQLKSLYPNVLICTKNIESPSVLKTIELSYSKIIHDHVLIHPIDLEIIPTLSSINISLLDEAVIFYKRYQPENLLLKLQANFLNKVDLNIRHNFVWTNAPIIKTTILKSFKPDVYGFLEDVQLSDWLKKKVTIRIIENPITVSSRRYIKKGTVKRFAKNVFIMLMYRLKLLSIEKLKAIYYS